MKRNIAIILCLLSTTSILSKAILIQCPQKSITKTEQIDISTYLISDEPATLLIEVHTLEQSIELLKYAQILKKRNKIIICKAPEEAQALLSWSPYIDHIFSQDDNYDLAINFSELMPYIKSIDSTGACPLLTIDETMLALWQQTFITDTNLKIGLCCHCNYGYQMPQKDLLSASAFAPLATFKYTNLYSFDDVDKNLPEIVNFFYFDKHAKQTLTSLATLIYHMDLMITTQPLIAYIAEALGKRTWLIVSAHIHIQELINKHPDITVFVKNSKHELLCSMLDQLLHLVNKPSTQVVTAEVAIGELIDKMTILEIKTEHIQDERKLNNIYTELESLQKTFGQWIDINPELEKLMHQLKCANEQLWSTEDRIRDKEREQCFDNEFIQLARKVYIQNDERCRIKRKINELAGSRLIEEKSYKPY